jgi:signal transduction histidine kinase
MEAKHTPADGVPAPIGPEVIAALLDLARLSHRAEFAIAHGTIATLLLERLLTLCRAQRGAVLSALQGTDRSRPYNNKTFRTVATHNMNEEEAIELLASFSLDGPDIQSPSGAACSAIARLPLSAFLSEEQGVIVDQRDDGADQPITEQPGPAKEITRQQGSTTTLLPPSALLVLVWDGEDEQACIAAVERGRGILPYITDVAGAVLMNILLVERVHELEAASDRTSLREMELLKAELLATVSHELRGPLASIKGYAATLLRHERRILREERHEFLLAINEASDRLAVVIDRLLEMSQLETGTIEIALAPVNLAYLVREAILAIKQRFVESGKDGPMERIPAGRFTFTLRLEDEHGAPTNEEPIIWADRLRLREVLDNLLENALHYSPAGGTIEVTLRPVFTAVSTNTSSSNDDRGKRTIMPSSKQITHQMVEICVCDTGIGIPPEHLERIFDRFHRVDTRLTREVNGIGLGLAICKHIVDLHHGTMWAESEAGKGSIFHVRLPVNAPDLQPYTREG